MNSSRVLLTGLAAVLAAVAVLAGSAPAPDHVLAGGRPMPAAATGGAPTPAAATAR